MSWVSRIIKHLLRSRPSPFADHHLLCHNFCSIGRYSCVHLRKEEAEDTLSVFPIEVVQVNFIRILLVWPTLRHFTRFRRASHYRSADGACVSTLHHLGLPHDPSKLWLFLLSLNGDFLTDLFLNLFKCFKEELFDLTSLVEHDLGQCTDILEFSVLVSKSLSAPDDVVLLVFDNLLVLEFKQLFLFLKIVNNLLKWLFKYHNFLL